MPSQTEERGVAGRRILVTGATGFIGMHLLRRLRAEGGRIFAVSHGSAVGPELLEGVQWRRAELADPQQVQRVFAEAAPELVFHLSGLANASRDRSLVYPLFASDVTATLHLLMAAADRPVARFVMTSSLEEPDAGGIPSSPYAAAKLASTAYGRMFERLYAVPVVFVRPYMAYGPEQAERKIIPYLIRTLLDGERPRLASPERLVDWIYVADVVEGIVAAALSPGVEGMTIDLGSGELVSIRRVAETLVRLAGSALELDEGSDSPRAHEQVRRADLRNAAEKLGWKPRTELESGLRATLQHQQAARALAGARR